MSNNTTIELYKRAYENIHKKVEPEFWKTSAVQGAVIGRFSELLLEECMTLCDNLKEIYENRISDSQDFTDKNMYAEGSNACNNIKHKIRDHFGLM